MASSIYSLYVLAYVAIVQLVLFPDPTLCEGKGSGDIGNVFLVEI